MLHPDIERLFALSGQVALVTGGGAGIGRGVAVRLAQAGADVAVVDLDATRAERGAGDVRALGRRALAIVADVSDEKAVDAMVDRTVRELGRVDILVNNAGIYPQNLIADIPVEQWDRVMAVNVRGPMLCTRAAVRAMRAAGHGGRIVNLSSTESFHPTFVGLAHYGASKAAINMLTKNAALEFAPDGIQVNAVCPGAVLTEGSSAGMDAGGREALAARIPLKRIAAPEDIASAVLFLASPAASFITGTTLLADGGYLLT
jgi:NAD(P)-dependent dehydrogenase (short-subunit alcohol dehydrogenase family)